MKKFLCPALMLMASLGHALSMPEVPALDTVPPAARQAAASIDPEKIRAHVRFLSSDLLEGAARASEGANLQPNRPTDEYQPNMDFRADARLAQFGFLLVWQALSSAPVTWKPGDEFEAARRRASGNQPLRGLKCNSHAGTS